jgi:hypothetical protein
MDFNLFGRTWLVNLSFDSRRLRLAHWLCVRAASRAILKNDENVAPRNYGRNRIVQDSDDPVTASRQSLRACSWRILCCRDANPLHRLR